MSDEKEPTLGIDVKVLGVPPDQMTMVEKAAGVIAMLVTLYEDPDEALTAVSLISKFLIGGVSDEMKKKFTEQGVAKTLEESSTKMLLKDHATRANRVAAGREKPAAVDGDGKELSHEDQMMLDLLQKMNKVGEA